MKSLRALFGSSELASTILLATCLIASPVSAVLTFPAAPSPNIDLSQLGRVAVAGNFDSASVFQYTQQSESSLNTNGSISVLSRFPSGAFATLQSSDAYIQAMCSFVVKGKLQGVVVAGNFTGLGGVESQGIALFKPDTATIQPLTGLNGKVNALYCDSAAGIVYIGGAFNVGNASNAVARTATDWSTLPFGGFNGAVTSITKNSAGNIVFGGSFDGIGNSTTPQVRDGQIIPVGNATLQAGPSSVDPGFNDPKNIICNDPTKDGPGNTWLLADNSPGAYTASLQFGFNPTKLRLYNTNLDGRGTKSFYFTAMPINGIMRFSYVDPSGATQFCDSECPMPQGNTTYQDFRFVNTVGMNGFRVDITQWYGSGGGLAGLALFQDDIYTFAVNDFNEPQCPGVTNPGNAQTAGAWTTMPDPTSAEYVSASITATTNTDAKVMFIPDIRQAGNYSVTLFTPGCLQDNTCATRGRVNVTGVLSAGNGGSPIVLADLYQTNNYDKYDQIYLDHVDATSESFKPSITITASSGQPGPLTIVAQRVRFELVSTSGGLNGLYEHNPSQTTVNMDFRKSTVDSAAGSLNGRAVVNSLAVQGTNLYVGGAFTSDDANNFFIVSPNDSKPSQGGLNGAVQTMYDNGTTVYVGGSFTGTRDSGGPQGLNGIAAFGTSSNSWTALGAGVRGSVSYIVPFQINLSSSKTTDLALAVSGNFDQINGFNGNPAIDVKNFAIYVPSRNNWLQNLHLATISVEGIITAQADVPDKNPPLFAGSVSSFDVGADGAFELSGSGTPTLQTFPINIKAPVASTGLSKRALSSQNITGVVAGAYYDQNNANVTVLGGHFSAPASNGSTILNLLIIDGKNSDKVTGLTAGISSDSVIRAVGVSNNLVYAGGDISGNVQGNDVKGLVVFDLGTSDYAKTQPAVLKGSSVVVNAIAPQPSGQSLYVGGDFDSAGTFTCPSLCVLDTDRQQWTSPGVGFNGQVAAMVWVDDSHLLIAGNLTINSTATSLSMYDSKAHSFTATTGDGGPTGNTITALTAGSVDGSEAWLAGTNTDGSTPFLTKFDGKKWTNVILNFLPGSTISGLQIFTLTNKHASSPLVDPSNGLLVTGQLGLPGYGNVSAALYNGTAFTPFLLTTTADGSPGSIAGVFVQNPTNFFKARRHLLAVGFIVLIGLAISLGIIFCIMGFGMWAERHRRKQQGYVQAPSPTNVDGINDQLNRIPPEELLGSTPHGRSMGGRGWTSKS